MKNKDKFIYPKINILRFSDTVLTSAAVTASMSSYAAGALADYVTGEGANGNGTGQQITTFKNVFGFNY
ncbi:MAG: hypothetical protein ACI4DP_07560 [Candidatus Ornithomonoglobus sp.]